MIKHYFIFNAVSYDDKFYSVEYFERVCESNFIKSLNLFLPVFYFIFIYLFCNLKNQEIITDDYYY